MYPTLSSKEIHNKNPTSILQHIHPRQDMELGLHSHPQMIHPPHFHTPYYHKSFPVYPTNTISNKQPKVWTGVLHELFGWTQTWMKGFVKEGPTFGWGVSKTRIWYHSTTLPKWEAFSCRVVPSTNTTKSIYSQYILRLPSSIVYRYNKGHLYSHVLVGVDRPSVHHAMSYFPPSSV